MSYVETTSQVEKCRSRGIESTSGAFASQDLRDRSSREYATLADDLEGALPPFDEAYSVVQRFYESLLWHEGIK